MHDDELKHYGIIRRSGRYPWGSGKDPFQNTKNFINYVDDLKKKGMTEKQIAQGLGINTTQLRAERALAVAEVRKAEEIEVIRLKDKQWSNVAIGKRIGRNESQVRNILKNADKDKRTILETTRDQLKDQMMSKEYLDIGRGAAQQLGVTEHTLSLAVHALKEEGYQVMYTKARQAGGKETSVVALVQPGVSWTDFNQNRDKIQPPTVYSEDGGRSFLGILPPVVVDPSRVSVRYGNDGGGDADGVLYIRPGVDDLSLGGAHYAQVRVQVGKDHYLKGMAIYKSDLPKGVDIEFNTPKNDTGNRLDAMKALKDDADNPFGSTVRQLTKRNADGTPVVYSAMNLVNEEEDWGKWSKTISSQMLSKQNSKLAKEQLDIAFKNKQAELSDIMSVTNPLVKKKLLESFADDADSSAIHLKAAGLPRNANHVILPINSLKDNEVYAPNYRNGETVVLIRHPHGGIFEIPQLKVNNRNREAREIIGQAKAAIGINSKVAQQLSGADFDGDTVLVIPNNEGRIKTRPPLEGLKSFDPQRAYPKYEGMKVMSETAKQREMGSVSNLITDMTIRGASFSEIESAVKHSMVVIDAAKHELNYKQSEKDNHIKALRKKYQSGGASTIISRAKSPEYIDERELRKMSEGGPIDPKTGELVYVPTGRTHYKTGEPLTSKVSKMDLVSDARSLMSSKTGQPIEVVYANHANQMKSLANQARKASVTIKNPPVSRSAKEAYPNEVASINATLQRALKNKPLERRALLLAESVVSAKLRDNPIDDTPTIKKIKAQALNEARLRVGASRVDTTPSPKEWQAIQAGAISANKLSALLESADLEKVKEYSMPRTATGISNAQLSRARSMLSLGYTQAEVADVLGISTSTLNKAL